MRIHKKLQNLPLEALNMYYWDEHKIIQYNYFKRKINFVKVTKQLLEKYKEGEDYDLKRIVRHSENDIITGICKILADRTFSEQQASYMQGLRNIPINFQYLLLNIDKNVSAKSNLLKVITMYKIDRKDAITMVLHYLIDPKLRAQAKKNNCHISPRKNP